MGDFMMTNIFTGQTLFQIVFTIVLLLAPGYALYLKLMEVNQDKQRERVTKGYLKGDKSKNLEYFTRNKTLNKLYIELEQLLKNNKKEDIAEIVFFLFMGFLFFIFISMIFVRMYFLAVVLPFALVWYAIRLIRELKPDEMQTLHFQLPGTIDNIIREMSRYNDLQRILKGSASTSSEPMKGILNQLSIELTDGDQKSVLEKFAKKYNTSVWLTSLSYTLISYIEETGKDDTVKNLLDLRQLLYEENQSKLKVSADRKYGIIINYALAVIGALMGVGNILFNPNAKEFFFSTLPGIISFVLGYSLILMTIMYNVRMSKVKK